MGQTMRRGSLRIAAAVFWSSTTISIVFSNGNFANWRRLSRFFWKTVSAALLFIYLLLELLELVGQPEILQDPAENGPIDDRIFQQSDQAFPVLGPARLQGDGRKVFGRNDPGLDIPVFQSRSVLHGLAVGDNGNGANNGRGGVVRKELSPRLSPFSRSSGVS
jgi:hypothetical protein